MALLSRLRLAMRYALNTTANYRTDSGGYDQKRELPEHAALHAWLRRTSLWWTCRMCYAVVETLVTETVLLLVP